MEGGPPPHTARMQIKHFLPEHASAIASMCQEEGWESWTDVEAVSRALSAPGVTTLVAVEDGEVVGAAQVLSDGEINWVLGTLIVAAGYRRRGIGTQLVAATFDRADARRLDLLSEGEGRQFYSSFPGREMNGFRLYPRDSQAVSPR